MSMSVYYKAKITTKADGEADAYIVELGYATEDGYEVYDIRNVGFDPASAEVLAKAWKSGQHGLIQIILQSTQA